MVKSTTLSATREDSTGDNLFSRYNKAVYISVLRRKNQLFSQSMVASTGQTTGSSFNGKRLFLFAMVSVMQTSRWVFKMYSNFPFSGFGSISWSIFSNCFCFVFLSSVWGKKLLGVT